MKIKAIGKQHLKGTSSKTGKDYDFFLVHYVGKEDGVEGESGQRVAVDPAFVPYSYIEVGKFYEVEFGPRGRVVSFTRCAQ